MKFHLKTSLDHKIRGICGNANLDSHMFAIENVWNSRKVFQFARKKEITEHNFEKVDFTLLCNLRKTSKF